MDLRIIGHTTNEVVKDMKYSREDIRKRLKLYFVMGSNNCIDNPVDVLEAAIAGGITLFQFREKGIGSMNGLEKIELAIKLQSICKRHAIPFIVNDDVDLAIEIDADGVHIGQEDENPIYVRERMGDRILGISVHNVLEAEKAVGHGADYVGVGPMYQTTTKKDIRDVKGPSIIAEIRNHAIHLPIVGIGGIQGGLVQHVIEAGADGVAVISAISQANQPQEATKKLLDEVEHSIQERIM